MGGARARRRGGGSYESVASCFVGLISVAFAVSLLVGMLVYTAQPARAAEDGVDDLLGI